jgi:acetyl-CoA carboxylase alpha subunit
MWTLSRSGFLLQLRTDTYNRLTPVQQLHVARHPNRPTFLDIALNITDKFVELHGDRAGTCTYRCCYDALRLHECTTV